MKNASCCFAAALLVCALLLSATVVGSATPKRIALVYDDSYVDTDLEDDRIDWGEARNLRAFLVSRNFIPRLITDYDDVAGWNTTLANARTVIFPEDSGTAPAESVEHIRTWVSGGGVAVFCRLTLGVARQLTELSLGDDKKRGVGAPEEGPWAKTSDGTASSLFADGPAQVEALDAVTTWYLDDDLPAEAASLKCMYGTTGDCAVWVYAQDSGMWIGVAPDFYDFGYAGGQDGGWVSVMASIAAYGATSSASQLTSWATWVASALL